VSDTEYGLSPDPGYPTLGRQDDPWLDWLEAVGIGTEFPSLGELRWPAPDKDEYGRDIATEDSKRWFLNRPHLLAVSKIYKSLKSARAIVTRPGQGATTLARYLYQKAESDTLIRSSIPVLISLEDLINESYASVMRRAQQAITEARATSGSYPFSSMGPYVAAELTEAQLAERESYEDETEQLKDAADLRAAELFREINSALLKKHIEQSIETAVVRSLVSQPWELAMSRSNYRDILNAKSPQTSDLEERRYELARFVSQDPMNDAQKETLGRLAPRLVPKDTRDLVAELNKLCGVRISLILDLSATPLGRFYISEDEGEHLTEAYRAVLNRVASAIKNIEQGGASQPSPTLPSLLNKTYIMSEEAWIQFSQAEARQEDEVIRFPSLRPIDLFAMLAHHYPTHQDESGRRAEALAAVVDSRFVQITDRRAISTEMALMRGDLRTIVELYGEASYQLSSQAPPVMRIASAILNAIENLQERPAAGSLAGSLLRELTKLTEELGPTNPRVKRV
jgi:hypothetical protein